MTVILYSTHCPKCNVLEKKLSNKNIEFIMNNNEDEMIQKGFMSAPMLEVNGIDYNFNQARKIVDNYDINSNVSFEEFVNQEG